MYLCIVYLMTLSAARNIWRRMAEWLKNVEVESLRKGVTGDKLGVDFGVCQV
jgi:hypothetical protein